MNFSGKKENALSVFKYYNYLPLRKKSEKINGSFLRKTLSKKFDNSSNSPSLPLIAGIESGILGSLLIFNPGFFYFSPFLKANRENVETRADLNLIFFLNLTRNFSQEFEPCVWTCDLEYTHNESSKYFQSLVLTRVQYQN